MAAFFMSKVFMAKPLAQSQCRCSHNRQCGCDRYDDRDNAGVSIRFLVRQLRDGEHGNDRTTVGQ